mmetsp:Transcript_53949/g.101164  ORF Transcript_53949/g.101164 Transcript_53949/m.101164 type:complete len:340 (+) Transcript_53949:82-1101(+)
MMLFSLLRVASVPALLCGAQSLRGSELRRQVGESVESEHGHGPDIMFDPDNHSMSFDNVIACRYGVRCRGDVMWHNTGPLCTGRLTCWTEDSEAGGKPLLVQSTDMIDMTDVQDASNSTHVISNLLVCRYGSYCRGGLHWYHGQKVCQGGILCRPHPFYMQEVHAEEDLESLKTLPNDGDEGREWDDVLKHSLPHIFQDEANTTRAVANVLVCRYGSYCHGGWWWQSGRRVCKGSIVCRSGPYEMEVNATAAPLDVDHAELGSPLSPVEVTYDLPNHSYCFNNVVVCEHGVACDGSLYWVHGAQRCGGSFSCESRRDHGDGDPEAVGDAFHAGFHFTLP